MSEPISIFFSIYPDGFNDEAMLKAKKKHDDSKIIDFFANLTENDFKNKRPETLCEQISKILSKSTMISTFEKITFRNYIANKDIQLPFLMSLYNLIYYYNEESFNDFIDALSLLKEERNAFAAKWPIVTFFTYYNIEHAFPVKPTTVKKVAKMLNFDIEYNSRPNFTTYEKINTMYNNFKNNNDLLKNEHKRSTHALLYIANTV